MMTYLEFLRGVLEMYQHARRENSYRATIGAEEAVHICTVVNAYCAHRRIYAQIDVHRFERHLKDEIRAALMGFTTFGGFLSACFPDVGRLGNRHHNDLREAWIMSMVMRHELAKAPLTTAQVKVEWTRTVRDEFGDGNV